jgi:hypothetical protein
VMNLDRFDLEPSRTAAAA